MEACRILHSNKAQHAAFFRFVDSIFLGVRNDTWTRWRDCDGWTDGYEVFAMADHGKIISTVGRSRMHLVINGEDRIGYQLGAVATLEPYRGQGVARRLMDEVISTLDEPDQPIILFANRSVLDFYPRFGFRRVPQRRSVADISAQPVGTRASRCDVSDPAHRSLLAQLCARARPIRGHLAARDYYRIALWNLTCGPVEAFWLDEYDAAVAVTIENERLVLHDVFATRPFDLSRTVPRLTTQRITEVEFRFNPEDWWPAGARHLSVDDTDSALFVRGAASLVSPVQFPALAHT